MDFLTDAFTGQLFFGSVILASVAEFLLPLRPLRFRVGPRWLANIGLGAANMLIARWILPISGAFVASAHGIGLFHQFALPVWAEIVIGVLLLDLLNYAIHRAMHVWPLLWRVHNIHHTDLDVDFTTGVRHHPLESIVVLVVTALAIFALGLSPLALAAYLAGRAVIDITSHANIRVPAGLDRVLRWVIITPDMHRIHHSAWQPETDSNYGTLLSVWDRLFGSYCAAPRDGQKAMTLGLEHWRDEAALGIGGLMLMPFSEPPVRPAAPPSARRPAPPPE